MHPRITELLEFLDRNHRDFMAAFERVAPELRETRPAADRWSAAEIVAHVSLVEHSVAQVISSQIAVAKARGVEAERSRDRILPLLDTQSPLLRDKKLKSPLQAHPKVGITSQEALSSFARAHQNVVEAVKSGDGLDLSRITFSHPLLGTLNMYQWIAFVGGHEGRHALQLDELHAQLGVTVKNAP